MTAAEKTRLLAERAMGWRVHFRNTALYVPIEQEYSAGPLNVTARIADWDPLTNLAHAGEVLEAMRAKGWKYSIADNDHGTHLAVLYRDTFTSELAESESLPTAICHAALLAEGVKEEDLWPFTYPSGFCGRLAPSRRLSCCFSRRALLLYIEDCGGRCGNRKTHEEG